MRREYEQQHNGDGARVFGGYVGWNGSEGRFPFNIGSRARAADRIAASPDFDRDLKALVAAALEKTKESTAMIIGHSLGGRILSRYLLGYLQSMDHPLFGAQTLFVIINPAIGADAFDGLFERSKSPSGTMPLLLRFTSAAGPATKSYFFWASTLGKVLGLGYGITDSFWSWSGSPRSTIGHYRPYQTHRIEFEYFTPRSRAEKAFLDPKQKHKPIRTPPFADYPKIPDGRSSHWFVFDGDKASNERAPYFDKAEDATGAYYTLKLSKVDNEGIPYHVAPSEVWNIVGNSDLSDCGVNAVRKASTCPHNAFIQTSLTRMLIEFHSARARSQ
jgi:pimeloyl-ACP methyl ester carboxylesterase